MSAPPSAEPPAGPAGPPVVAPFLGAAARPNPGPPQAWLARPYPQLLRGPTYRWWRPLASLGVLLASGAGIVVVAWLSLGAFWALSGDRTVPGSAQLDAWTVTAPGLAWTNLVLAALIVGAQLAVWGGYGWRPRWVASVAGGIRWAWLLRCYLAAAVVIVVVTAGLVVLGGGMGYHPPRNALVLGAVILLTTPLQAAGEEYLFRGWLTQAVGSVVPRAGAGAVAAALVSSTLFALAHGQQDAWLFADRFGYGLVASWLVWRTGGLEASIAVHTVLNLVAFGLAIASDQLSDMVVETSGTAVGAVSDLGLILLAAVVIDQLGRRSGVARLFRPPVRAW